LEPRAQGRRRKPSRRPAPLLSGGQNGARMHFSKHHTHVLASSTQRTRTASRCLALAASACALGGCAGAGNPAASVTLTHPPAFSCPGGGITTLGVRTLVGARRSSAPGCPYAAAVEVGRSGEGVFREPDALAVSPSSRVYVADQFSHVVQIFSSSGVFEGQFGSGGAGPGELGEVGGLAVDRRGDVYVVDSSNDRVEEFSARGVFITAWGSKGSGVGEFNFGGGGSTYRPPGGGITVGRSFVYVSDTGNNRIQRFALDGSGGRVLVGAGSGPGEVLRPHGLAVAPAETGGAGQGGAPEALYVADDGNDRVQELTPAGRFMAQAGFFPVAPGRFETPPKSVIPGGFLRNSQGQLVRTSVPFDVAVHGARVYVADDNYGAIVELTRDLRVVGSFSGSGRYELTKFVRAVATDDAGRVYVADASAGRVIAFDSSGTPLRRWGVTGSTPGQLLAPVDVAVAAGGVLLVAEPFRNTGEIVPLYPSGGARTYRALVPFESPWSSGGGVMLGTHLFSPSALALARDGSVWVADRNNRILRHLSPTGSFLGAIGALEGVTPRTVSFDEPDGVTVDSAGDVIVADAGVNRVYKFAPDGRLLAAWLAPDLGRAASVARARPAAAAFRRPRGVAAGPHDSIYVADTDNARIVEMDGAGRLIASFGGRGSAPGRFEQPDGIAVDPAGDVFVADGVLDRIQEFTASGSLLAVWGAAGTSRGELSEPSGLTVDCHGDLWVADTGNNRVQAFTGVAAPTVCPS
jgi:tripartite motif-containing protein 71